MDSKIPDAEFYVEHEGEMYVVQVTYRTKGTDYDREVDENTVKIMSCEGDNGAIEPTSIEGLEKRIIKMASSEFLG